MLSSVGIPVFGPSARAARMEGSKAFSKDFMIRHSIPTASYRTFNSSQVAEAESYVESCGHRVVIKASGLAAGKGVLIPESTEEAIKGLKEIMIDRVFGDAGCIQIVSDISKLTHKVYFFGLFRQALKLLWKNIWKGLNSLFSPSPMDTPSPHCRRHRIIKELEMETLGSTLEEWARTPLHQLQLRT